MAPSDAESPAFRFVLSAFLGLNVWVFLRLYLIDIGFKGMNATTIGAVAGVSLFSLLFFVRKTFHWLTRSAVWTGALLLFIGVTGSMLVGFIRFLTPSIQAFQSGSNQPASQAVAKLNAAGDRSSSARALALFEKEFSKGLPFLIDSETTMMKVEIFQQTITYHVKLHKRRHDELRPETGALIQRTVGDRNCADPVVRASFNDGVIMKYIVYDTDDVQIATFLLSDVYCRGIARFG